MQATVNNRIVYVSLEWSFRCQVQAKSGRKWPNHYATCYTHEFDSAKRMIDVQLMMRGHKLLKINSASCKVAFAFYDDDFSDFDQDYSVLEPFLPPVPQTIN